MNYHDDCAAIRKLPPDVRRKTIWDSAYVNDYDAALVVLKESSNVNRDAVMTIARFAFARDAWVEPKKKVEQP